MLTYLCLIDGEERKKSFEKIYNENYLRMYHIALSILKNPASAEDAVHEAFFSIAKNFKIYSKLSCREMEGLCVTIVKNKTIDQLRYQKRFSDEVLVNLVLYNEYAEFEPERHYQNKQESVKIHNILKKLPEILRMTVDLKYFYDLRNKEIAKIMNVPVKTIEMRLYRAKIKIRELWENEE
jgi:RNA polymerase sigma-70 factor (ECF subfamily)